MIDQGRRRGRRSGRVLLLGSASLDLMRQSLAWRKDLLRTYLERDVPMFGSRIPAETLRRFWTMLAHNQGTLINASRLAAGLEVSSQSVSRYTDLLVDLLLVRHLAASIMAFRTIKLDTSIIHK